MASTKYLTCIHKLPQNANLNQALESTNAAPRLPHRSPTWPDVVSSVRLADSPPFFFFLFAPTRPNSRRFQQKRESIRSKWPSKHVDTADSGRNGQRLPFFCFMSPCEREKKKKGWKKNKGM